MGSAFLRGLSPPQGARAKKIIISWLLSSDTARLELEPTGQDSLGNKEPHVMKTTKVKEKATYFRIIYQLSLMSISIVSSIA